MLLCVSLYCTMSVFGNGPPRVARYAEATPSTAPASSGIRVLPAPPRVVLAQPAQRQAAETLSLAAFTASPAPDRFAAPQAETSAPPPPANLQLRWVTAGTANVRAQPNKRSDLAGKVGLGEAVYMMWAEPNGWVRIRSTDGAVTGFVHKSLLTDEEPATASVDLATAD